MRVKSIRILSLLLAISILVSLIPSSNAVQQVAAQTTSSAISGHITDSAGIGVEGVTVLAVQVFYKTMLPIVFGGSTNPNPIATPIDADGDETNFFTILTDSEGYYSFNQLPAGNYKVTARKVGIDFNPITHDVDTSKDGGPYNFEETIIPLIYAPNTRNLSADTLSQLVSVSEDEVTFTFNPGGTEIGLVEPGDIIIGGVSPLTPTGFMQRVLTKQEINDTIIFTTKPAGFQEAYESLSINERIELAPFSSTMLGNVPGVEVVTYPSIDAWGDFNQAFNNSVIYDEDGDVSTTDDQIVANGSLRGLIPVRELRIRVEENYFEVYVALTFEVQAGYRISSTASFFNIPFVEKKFFTHKFHPFTFEGVLIFPTFDIVGNFEGSIVAGVSSTVVNTSSITAGLWWINGEVTLFRGYESNFSYDPLNSTTAVSFKASVGPKLSFKAYNALGAYVKAEAAVKLEIAPTEDPFLTLEGGVGASVCLSLSEPLFGHEVFTYDVKSIEQFWRLYSLSSSSNTQPDPPFDPYPADGAYDQSLFPRLGWSGLDRDGDLIVYDVYMSADYLYPTNKIADHQTANYLNVGPLQPYTTYFWKVVAFDQHGMPATGPVWSFSTSDSTIIPGEMVYIPAGEFKMGCDPAHNGGYSCSSDELPLHNVYLDAFYIDKTEVTNAQYEQCVSAGACDAPYSSSSYTRADYYGNAEYDNYPVVYVDWYRAEDYCTWAGKRLPTEAEWEKAARGTSPKAYPWGDGEPTCSLANSYNDATSNYCVGDTSAVGSYPSGASPYGALDMAGNVWEWVSDWWDGSYYASQTSWNNPTGPSTGTYKVLRGGSWLYGWTDLRTAARNIYYPDLDSYSVGFRCVSPSGN